MEEDRYIQLLYRQLAGEIEPSEAQELSQWRASSVEHEREAQSVELAWQLTGPAEASAKVDLDAEFADLQAKMVKDSGKLVSMRSRGRSWLRIAAAVALLVSALSWWWTTGGDQVQPEWVSVTTTSTQRTIVLADQSKVVLNTNSELRYPTAFVGDSREVVLSGEAFFDVTKNPASTFVIETPHAVTTVLGTSFNLKDEATDPIADLQVTSGRVQFADKTQAETVIVEAGQAARWKENRRQISLVDQPSENALAWRTGQLQFVGTPLAQVFRELAQQFDINFTLDNTSLADCPFDSQVEKPNIDLLIEDLEAIFTVEVIEIGPGSYQLKGGRCP